MKLCLNVSDDLQLVITADALEPMKLEPGDSVEVEISNTRSHKFDQEKWDRVMAKIEEMRPAFQRQMLEDGYASVDEMMADLRPEW